MSKYNGQVEFINPIGGVENLQGELRNTSRSGVYITNTGNAASDIILPPRPHERNPLLQENGSFFMNAPSGYIILKTKDILHPIGQPVTIGPFFVANPAANSMLDTYYGGVTASDGVIQFVAPYNGSIIAISLRGATTVSAGSATADVEINGVTPSNPIQTSISAGQVNNCASQIPGVTIFDAGDTIAVRIDTDASWSPTTNDLAASLFILLETDF